MGTYLQGVQSIIPSIQPHDPGINMVANLLQLKQNQYDTNYKSLNKMYGQFYYADLTREDNIQKRDNTVQQIDFDLKRISGLDLSSEQNVQQASQIFKPFYEDGALMKDMAWTKNFNNTLGAAEGLSKSDDEKVRAQAWDDGIKELQYKREEFKNASADEAMRMGSPEYTPYVNVQEKMLKLKKDANLSFEKTSMSQNGKWILKNKNGELLVEPLANLFEAQLGADPAVQKVYKTQSYVNRKDFAYGEAEKYGGVKEAEMFYLEDAYGKMKKLTETRHADKQANTKVYDAKIADLEAQIKQEGSDPLLEKQLAEYKSGKETNDVILGKLDQQLTQFNSAYSSSGNTSTGQFQNPYKDIDQLRRVVDGNMADTLMNEDIMDAASHLAYTDAKEDFKENPYAVLDVKHAHQMSEINQAGSWRYKTETLKGQNALNTIKAKAYYDEYTYSGDKKAPKSGSGSGSGSGKKVTDEQVANAQAVLANPFQSEETKLAAKAVIKKSEEQKEQLDGGFKRVDVKSANLDKQNTANIEGQTISTLFDQKGKMGVLGLLKLYDQQMNGGGTGPKMTQQQFYDLTKPPGAPTLIPRAGSLDYMKYSDFTDPKVLMKKVESEGANFMLKHTNKEEMDVKIKNTEGKTIHDAMDIVRKQAQGIPYGSTKWSTKKEDNYLASFLAKGTDYVITNSNLTSVKAANAQGLDTQLSIASTISNNIQDSRKWRYETKKIVTDDVYNKFKNDPQMMREFGVAKFDKNGKYVNTDMSRLKEGLNGMYDEAGNLNPNHKLKTNRQISLDQAKNASQIGEFSFGSPDVVTSRDYSDELRERVSRAGQGAGAINTPTNINEAAEEINASLMRQFVRSASDVYSDNFDKGLIKKIPGYKKVNTDGGTGFGSEGLQSRVDLSKPFSLGAITFWEFTKDWANMRNSIDGLDRVISFEEPTVTGLKSGQVKPGMFSFTTTSLDETTSATGKRLLDDYMEWTKKHGTKANAFDMTAQRIAAQDMSKGAMTINLPDKFLKEMLQEEKNPGGYLTQDNYDNLTKYGLSIIAPNKDFNNALHNSTMTPLQSTVEYNDEFVWNHPSGLGSFKIKKGGPNDPDYITEQVYRDYNGKQAGTTIYNNSTSFGGNLEGVFGDAVRDLNGWAYEDLKKFSQQQQNVQMQSPGNTQNQ
jgi:hypothetical protein